MIYPRSLPLTVHLFSEKAETSFMKYSTVDPKGSFLEIVRVLYWPALLSLSTVETPVPRISPFNTPAWARWWSVYLEIADLPSIV
jgi:hypothetical protein